LKFNLKQIQSHVFRTTYFNFLDDGKLYLIRQLEMTVK